MVKNGIFVLGVVIILLTFQGYSSRHPVVNSAEISQQFIAPMKYNVLFIPVDDLNHWVGYLGRNNQVITPNLDKLAASGLNFYSAHCAAPACNPSRAALMTGVRPYTSGVYSNSNDWRPVISASKTLPTVFARAGYEVSAGGKIYHGGYDREGEFGYYFKDPKDESAKAGVAERGGFGGIKWAQINAGDEVMADYKVASWAISELRKKHGKPFFLGAGIFRPHLPWNCPKQYFDMYPLDKIKLPATLPDDLEDLPDEGVRMAHQPGDDHKQMLKQGELAWRRAVQAYMANITFADAQIGRIIDALDQSEYGKNTIVVLWGDHGWSLGEKQHWRKFALWEETTRAPLIFRVPGVTRAGSVCYTPVDFMNVFPTLAQLCGIELPSHVEGVSMVSLLKKPDAPWTRPAITTMGFGNHSVRTKKWRYISYLGGGQELYDEENDRYEFHNLASDPKYRKIISQLKQYLPKHNQPEISRTKAGNEGE